MKVFCTYCSSEKSSAPGKLPAIQRYRSSRIEKIYNVASQLDVGFYILSGEYGLIPPDEPIPYYDHLLAAGEAPRMSKLIGQQIIAYGITGIVYFTKPLSSGSKELPYYNAIADACQQTALPFMAIELKPEENTMDIDLTSKCANK